MPRIPVALQMWSLRDLAKVDFAQTVLEVAAMGFTGVELAGYGNLDAPGVAKALRAAGLSAVSMHVGIAALRSDFNRVVADAHLLGSRHVVCPHFTPELFRSAAACQAIGEELNQIGARLRAFGLRFGYHNHAFELAQVEGRHGLDWLLDAAEPRNLGCEADVYWLQVGGKDAARFLHEQGRRVELLHVKDETELGTGPVNFPEVFAAVDHVGSVQWFIIEVERYNHAPLESVRRSFEQLKAWGRA